MDSLLVATWARSIMGNGHGESGSCSGLSFCDKLLINLAVLGSVARRKRLKIPVVLHWRDLGAHLSTHSAPRAETLRRRMEKAVVVAKRIASATGSIKSQI